MPHTPYVPQTWDDQVDSKPKDYLVDGEVKEIEKDVSGVSTPGSPVNAARMGHIEGGIDSNSQSIVETENRTLGVLVPPTGVTASNNIEITVPDQTYVDGQEIKFYLAADFEPGGNITLTIKNDTPATILGPLEIKDIEEANLTNLAKGYVTVYYQDDVTDFFEWAPSAIDEWGGLKFIIDTFTDRLYSSDYTADEIYEIDPDTKLQLSFVSSPSTQPNGIGGIKGRLYHGDNSSDLIYELDPDTKIVISSAASPGANPLGVGGMELRLYECDLSPSNVYELDPDTKLQISSVASPGTTSTGIGGMNNNRLYLCDQGTTLIYELDPDTKLQTSNASSPSTSPYGVGGTLSRLYHCDNASDLIYELDPDTKLQTSSASAPNNDPRGVGGYGGNFIAIRKVEFNSTEYELVDDSVFKVTGVSS